MDCEHKILQLGDDAPFDRLPDEVLLRVLMAIGDVASLRAWSLTSRRHHQLALDDLLWRYLCETHFGPSPFEPPLPPHVNWRWIYQAQSRPARPTGTDVGAVRVQGSNARIYWGDVVDGQPHGFGVCIYGLCLIHDDGLSRKRIDIAQPTPMPMTSVDRTQCEWVHGKMHGTAVETNPSGTKIKRLWENDVRACHGTIVYVSGASTKAGSWPLCLMATAHSRSSTVQQSIGNGTISIESKH
ncbi:Morn repeat protein [Pandoravirus inopinatum]|uniref:Morn repeat protein n=1 Tax=Pandoravirus inopinatum TaxID=1605721 RepID=A0A0B5IXD1_9VIRU|nr:Morn repeat protein [Pandoravirus inopinatum]AJF97413.1 Morn repeat protein [Pandoravirus inopinatum]